MKISSINTTLYRPPFPQGQTTETYCLVELGCDRDLTGIAISREWTTPIIVELFKHCLIDEDPRATGGLWQRMQAFANHHGHGSLIHQAIGALDVALWDLKAKLNNEPLWKTLGGSQPRAKVHASIKSTELEGDALQQQFNDLVNRFGIQDAKLLLGNDLASNIDRLHIVRQALQQNSSSPMLMVDACQSWTRSEAIRKIAAIEQQFDITFVEAPCAHWDFISAKCISDNIRAAVCNGAELSTLGDFLPHFHHRAIDVVQANVLVSGITGLLQLADTAFGFELPITLAHSPGNFLTHVAGALPYFMTMEVTEFENSNTDIITSNVVIRDGWATVGDDAGNGLAVNRDSLAKVAITSSPFLLSVAKTGATQ